MTDSQSSNRSFTRNITEVKSDFGIIDMSDYDASKVCPQAEHCGGCIYQGVKYEEQFASKDKAVRRLLEKHDIDEAVYLGMKPALSCYAYRNKMEYTFGDLEKGGELELGMHFRGRFMSILTTDECQLVPACFNQILHSTLEFCRSKGYRPYHRKTHEGLLRNLIVRCGVRTGEVLVNIVTSSTESFNDEGFKDMLLGLNLAPNISNGQDVPMHIVGILHTYNDSVADAVIDERHELLHGRDYYNEKILGLKFRVKAFAFFQTNIDAIERLYSDLMEVVPDVSGKTVYDLYCGTGTISQLLASKAKEVYGIEIVEDAVEAARENTELNGIQNCHYICGDVRKTLDEIPEKPDMIVVDPPRAGIHDKAVDMLCSYGIEEMVYVSCNPKTLCINLDRFRTHGYEIRSIQAYDNFPMTKHVETVVKLSQKHIDHSIRVELDLDEFDETPSELRKKATYKEIKQYILDTHGVKVSTLYISQIKRKCGLEVGECYNKPKSERVPAPECPPEKEKVIIEALKHFKMIQKQ